MKRYSPYTTLFYVFFVLFENISEGARASAKREKETPIFFFPHPYSLALAVNQSPRVFYFLSRALDGL